MNLDPTRDWKTLLSFLPPDYERLAVEHKLLNTQYANVKVGSAAELLRLFFVHAGRTCRCDKRLPWWARQAVLA